MIRVKLEADTVINAIRINGDFFLHPEESLPNIEKNLVGHPVSAGEHELAQKIHETLAKERAAFIGVTPEDIAGAIIQALQNMTPIQNDAPV